FLLESLDFGQRELPSSEQFFYCLLLVRELLLGLPKLQVVCLKLPLHLVQMRKNQRALFPRLLRVRELAELVQRAIEIDRQAARSGDSKLADGLESAEQLLGFVGLRDHLKGDQLVKLRSRFRNSRRT